MHLRLPVVLLSVFALAAPGAMAYGKEKDKNKNKNKAKSEQRSDDRRGSDDDRDRRDDDRGDWDGDRDGKMTICHIPPGNRSARHTISVSESAWAAHRGHGDIRGACGNRPPNPGRGFDALDVNNDHRLSFDEFRGDRVVFDRLDRDDDHFLSRDEFSRR